MTIRGLFDFNSDLEDFSRLLNKDEFEEEPVDLERFVTHQEFLGQRPLSPVQMTMVDRMSQIYLPQTLINLYGNDEGQRLWLETVNEVVCEIGKGGGKDFSIRIAFARIIYYLHCLRDPLDYYGKGRGEYIDLLNIALNDAQAQKVFFDPLKNLLAESPYFQRQGFYPMAKEVKFDSKPIRALSGHSGAEGWEGFNLIAVVLDEIAAFKTEDELGGEKNRYSAKAIYDMARMSVISRFPSVGKIALLSFPRYQGDFIEQKYNNAIDVKKTTKIKKKMSKVTIEWEEDTIVSYREPKIWAIKCPTFISNPTKSPEDFENEFIRDPIETKSRILCMPPMAQQAYFRDGDRVRRCFNKDWSPFLDTRLQHLKEEEDWPKEYPFLPDKTLRPEFRDIDGPYRWVHIDLGVKHDRAALCMVHCEGFSVVQTMEGMQKMPVITMDVIEYWEALPDQEIDFNQVRQLALDLSTRFNIAQISIDKWQSEDTVKIFNARGIWAESILAVDKRHYDTLATTIYDGRLHAYYHPILVDQELLRLQLVRGKKVDHPRSGYKDGADCLAGAVYFCTVNTNVDQEIEIVNTGILEEAQRREDIDRERAKYKKEPEKKEMPEDLSDFLKSMQII